MNSSTDIYQDFGLLPYFETLGTAVFLTASEKDTSYMSNMSLPEAFLNLPNN